MVTKLLSEMEQELGFTLQPTYRYGNFSELKWMQISTPEDLFAFVDTFYTATLLYFRTFPILHFYSSIVHTENKKLVLGSEDITGYELLIKLEAGFPDILRTLESPIDKSFIDEWNEKQKIGLKKLSKLQWRTSYRRVKTWQETYKPHYKSVRVKGVWRWRVSKWVKTYAKKYSSKKKKIIRRVGYSTKISEFFRDELIARMELYKKLREELAKSLDKEIRDFSQLHSQFDRYFGSMQFFDLYAFGHGLREGNVGLLWYPDAEGYLEHLVSKCSYAESRANDDSYLQEYFFTVREYYKEVIKKTLELVNTERYTITEKKDLLNYLLYRPGLFYDLEDMERIWHPYSEGTIGTWKYGDFMQGVHDIDRENIEDMQRFLVELYAFITENPEFSHSYPKDPAARMLMESILERKPINPDDLLEKMERKKKKS